MVSDQTRRDDRRQRGADDLRVQRHLRQPSLQHPESGRAAREQDKDGLPVTLDHGHDDDGRCDHADDARHDEQDLDGRGEIGEPAPHGPHGSRCCCDKGCRQRDPAPQQERQEQDGGQHERQHGEDLDHAVHQHGRAADQPLEPALEEQRADEDGAADHAQQGEAEGDPRGGPDREVNRAALHQERGAHQQPQEDGGVRPQSGLHALPTHLGVVSGEFGELQAPSRRTNEEFPELLAAAEHRTLDVIEIGLDIGARQAADIGERVHRPPVHAVTGMQVVIDRLARECRDLFLPLDVADRAVRRAVEVQSDRPPGKRVQRDPVILQTFAQVLFRAALDQVEDPSEGRTGFPGDAVQRHVLVAIDIQLEDEPIVRLGLCVIRVGRVERRQRGKMDEARLVERRADFAAGLGRIAELLDHRLDVFEVPGSDLRPDGDQVLGRGRGRRVEFEVEPARERADIGQPAPVMARESDAGL